MQQVQTYHVPVVPLPETFKPRIIKMFLAGRSILDIELELSFVYTYDIIEQIIRDVVTDYYRKVYEDAGTTQAGTS